MTEQQLSDPVVGAPTARSPWFATLVWTPEQNGGRVATSEARIPLGVLWGRLEAGESPEEVAKDFGLQVAAVHVVDQLRREVDDSRVDEAEVEDPGVGWGAGLIASERRRQVGEEGWSPGHDARHREGDLARAAATYALPAQHRAMASGGVPYWWPWAARWWKPAPDDRVRELTKAGALVAAEIDRLVNGGQWDRAARGPSDLVRAEHVSGVDVGDRGPSSPLVSPGPRSDVDQLAAQMRASSANKVKFSADLHRRTGAGNELAAATAEAVRLLPEGPERFRVQRAVRAWEEAR